MITKEKIQGLRNELLLKLNGVGNYETHKELWDAFYRYEEALSIHIVTHRILTKTEYTNEIYGK